MHVKPIRTCVFREGDELLPFILRYIARPPEGVVVVVTSKIVALSQQRTVPQGSEQARAVLIRRESTWAKRTRYVWLTMRGGMLMANAGIDQSNADGKIVLLPTKPFAVARELRAALTRKWKRKNLGVLITDSRTTPLRAGVIGVAVGYAGFRGLRDYRGTLDIFGRKFVYSRTNMADSLATAAVLTMGEGVEQQPLAVIAAAPVEFTNRPVRAQELKINPQDDMYAPLLRNVPGR